MKFNYHHLLNFFEKKPSIDELSSILFQLGHENEVDGNIFDLDVTPNRGDCLSLNGLARDLNHFFTRKEDLPIYQSNIEEFEFNFENLQENSCPIISFLVLEIDNEVIKYKDYLEDFFSSLENKKINFFTDVSNYLSYELGQPTHCYDFNSVSKGFKLDKLHEEKRFVSIHGQEIFLKKGDLVFTKDNEVINLAGLMGGKNSSCNEDTKKVLIECAHFRPEDIIGKNTQYDINSEASYKFERFVDPKLNEFALRRFIEIIKDHVDIKSLKISRFVSKKDNPRKIKFEPQKIKKILGIDIEDNVIFKILNNIYLEVIDNHILVPSFRNDIENNNDIAEEIARITGYDQIKSMPFQIVNLSKKDNFLMNLRKFLFKNGFTEVINFQFSKTISNESISIDNPLDINKSSLRTNIEESLVENLLYNEKRQKDSIKIFEISDLYYKEKNEIKQIKKICIMGSGRLGNNYRDFSKKIDKNLFTELFKEVGFDISNYLSTFDRAAIDTKKKDKIFYASIPIDALKDFFIVEDVKKSVESKADFKYLSVSEYPSSYRDFSFQVVQKDKIDSISEMILRFESDILKDVFLFDFFENKNDETFKAGFRFIFQDLSKTLTEKDINNELKKLLSEILALEDVSIPGYDKNVC